MSKPINENLKDIRVENESGDLIPLLDHAGDSHAVEQAFWSPSKLREALAPNAEVSGADTASAGLPG